LKTILVVEDDPPIADLISSLCHTREWTCDFAPDGDAAINKLRRGDYAAVVLDLMLPRRNGFDVVAFLRAERPSMLKRVVVVTAATPLTLAGFDAAPLGGLLHKPFDITELLDVLERCLSTE
jgi:DNA-binding response OmpR family regulator